MWSELTLKNFKDRTDLVNLLVSMQGQMNDNYKHKITPKYIEDYLDRKKTLSVRIFIYDDGVTQLDIVTKIVPDGLFLTTTALGNYTDLNLAVEIGQKKIIELMNEYGVKTVKAVYNDINYAKGDLWFNAFASKLGEDNGFNTANCTLIGKVYHWESTIL